MIAVINIPSSHMLYMDITVFGQLILITSIKTLNLIDVSRHF
jgi:hypothetical protein